MITVVRRMIARCSTFEMKIPGLRLVSLAPIVSFECMLIGSFSFVQDYKQKAETWMKPLVRGNETGLVEIPGRQGRCFR